MKKGKRTMKKTTRLAKNIEKALGGEKKFKPEYVAIKFDETKFYNIQPKDEPYIGRIFGIYVFNRREATHLAELTPSYFLMYAYSWIDYKKNMEKHERIRDDIEERYLYSGGNEDTYMHCNVVDSYCKNHPKDCYTFRNEFESLDDAREYLQGNWVL
jgi:hypothetical protein